MFGLWMAIAVSGSAQPHPASATHIAAKPRVEKLSYAVGVDLGRSIKRRGLSFQPESLAKGLRDGYTDSRLAISDAELQSLLTTLQVAMKRQEALRRGLLTPEGESNQKKGEAFLAANAAKPGVVSLPSGLQYRVLKPGDGRVPGDGDTVVCHFRAFGLDHKEFDNSYTRGAPLTMQVSAAMPGWREALKRMKLGARWQLFIPPQLAFGPRGNGSTVGPWSTVIYELELVSTK